MKKQVGNVLLLILLVLSLGAGSFSLQQLNRASGIGPIERALNVRDPLLEARTALLAYSADYATLYGPTGAGPGHLPCPDTDGLGNFVRDGPNPPCGSGYVATGALPRHVTLQRHRHAFHVEPDQRIQYAVSTAYVNNPVNRPVGASGSVQTDRTPLNQQVASLWNAGSLGFGVSAARHDSKAVITLSQLLQVVRPAVVRWFIQRANQKLEVDCSLEQPCELLDREDEERTDVEGEGQPEIQGVQQAEVQGEKRADVQNSYQSWQGIALVRWLMQTETGLIEGVTANRHWFVRNSWFEDIVVRVSDDCLAPWPSQTVRFCEFTPPAGFLDLPLVVTLEKPR